MLSSINLIFLNHQVFFYELSSGRWLFDVNNMKSLPPSVLCIAKKKI